MDINIYITLFPLIAGIITFTITYTAIKLEIKKRLVCRDVHKLASINVPCYGGPFLYIAFFTVLLAMYWTVHVYSVLYVLVCLTFGLIVGLLDDIYDLDVFKKVLLGTIPGLVIVLLHAYDPYPVVPFIGKTRLTIIYPLLVLAASTVFTNAANMVDTHNGLLVGMTTTIVYGAAIIKIVRGDIMAFLVLLCIATILTIYLFFNWYPATIFNGNSGSFMLGSILLALAVIFKLEFYTIISCAPMILNGISFITSLRRLVKKESIKERPVIMLDNGFLIPSRSREAPMTLIRLALLLASKPLSEKELVLVIVTTTILTTTLSIFLTIYTI